MYKAHSPLLGFFTLPRKNVISKLKKSMLKLIQKWNFFLLHTFFPTNCNEDGRGITTERKNSL